MRKKMFLKQVTEEIDKETGEIKTTQIIRAYKDKKPNESYFKVNVNLSIAIINSKIRKKEIEILLILANYMSYNNEIVIDNKLTSDIGDVMKISNKSIKNYVYSLVKQGFIKRVNENRYVLNPYYIGKGNGTALENLKLSYDEI